MEEEEEEKDDQELDIVDVRSGNPIHSAPKDKQEAKGKSKSMFSFFTPTATNRQL